MVPACQLSWFGGGALFPYFLFLELGAGGAGGVEVTCLVHLPLAFRGFSGDVMR